MLRSAVGTALFILTTNAIGDIACPLCGTWVSNEEKTMKSLDAAQDQISSGALAILTDGMFGRMHAEYTQSQARFWFPDTTGEEEIEWESYAVLERRNGNLRVEYFDPLRDENIEKMVVINGSCYYIAVDGFPFNEYFCRISK